MEKHNNKFSYNHHLYSICNSKNRHVYLNDDGILIGNSIHLTWEELFKCKKENEHKVKKDD